MESTIERAASPRVVAAMVCLLVASLPAVSAAATEAELQSAVFRAKPPHRLPRHPPPPSRPATPCRPVSLRERLAGVDHSGIQIGPSQKPHALWPLSQTGFTHWPL